MRRRYAQQTTVGADRSKAEIERLLERYGADQFATGWQIGVAYLGFRCHDKHVRFVLPLPDRNDPAFTETATGREKSKTQARAAYDQEVRRRWRALALVIKAKLEAVESDITSFETEFLAHILTPDGKTVGDHVVPRLEKVYETGRAARLLPAFAGTAE